MAVLSDDFFSAPEDRIKSIESVLSIVGGKIVYADGPFKQYNPPPLPVMPDWSPVANFGGAYSSLRHSAAMGGGRSSPLGPAARGACSGIHGPLGSDGLSCSCFVF